MEVAKITTGSWFPRTKLHLKEVYAFLRDGRAAVEENEEELRELRKKMVPRNVQYFGGRFDSITAEFDDITVVYHEDGLLTLSMKVSNYKLDAERLNNFYSDYLVPVLTILFGRGAPVLSYSIGHVGRRPMIVLTGGQEEVEVRKFCAENDDEVHFIARHTERTVYFAQNMIVLDDATGGAGITNYVISTLLLSREYERRLRDYLELYRTLWEKIAAIQKRNSIPSYELPSIRDELLSLRRDIAIIRARISQMVAYLKERKREIDDLGIKEDMRAVEAYRFDKLTGATFYITCLWDMLKDYIDSAVEITGFFYQENLQKEIGIQQFIFLIGSVAAIIGLGTIATAAFIVMDDRGETTHRGFIASFDIYSLLRFGGIAILASFIVFFGLRPAIRIFNRVRPTALLGKTRSTRKK